MMSWLLTLLAAYLVGGTLVWLGLKFDPSIFQPPRFWKTVLTWLPGIFSRRLVQWAWK